MVAIMTGFFFSRSDWTDNKKSPKAEALGLFHFFFGSVI